jgi:hypothetical protein
MGGSRALPRHRHLTRRGGGGGAPPPRRPPPDRLIAGRPPWG